MTVRPKKSSTNRAVQLAKAKLDALLAKATPAEKAWYEQFKKEEDAKRAKTEAEAAAWKRDLSALPSDVGMVLIGQGHSPSEHAALWEYLRQHTPAAIVSRLLADALENGWRLDVGDAKADRQKPALVWVPEGWEIRWRRTKRIRRRRFNAMAEPKKYRTKRFAIELATVRAEEVKRQLGPNPKHGDLKPAIARASKKQGLAFSTVNEAWKLYKRNLKRKR